MENQFGIYLANDGWAVYERATNRLVEVDGAPQLALRFDAAEQTANLLNAVADRSASIKVAQPGSKTAESRH